MPGIRHDEKSRACSSAEYIYICYPVKGEYENSTSDDRSDQNFLRWQL